MKILMVNKFFYRKGGSETYYFALKQLLESKGHEVIDFSMQDEKNLASPYADYFVTGVDYNAKLSPGQQLRAAANIIYSREAKKKLEKLVQKTRPDVAHLHIFQHQLSPSILDVLKKYHIPVVYTAHDLKMLCLNYVMLANGEICERCKGGHYLNCLKQKCVKASAIKSAVNVVEGYLHQWRKSYDVVDRIITPSRFYADKFVEFGVARERIVHLPNFLGRDCPRVNKSENTVSYFLYFGRLSREKGILTLLKAVLGTGLALFIVGDGPCKAEIEDYISSHRMQNVKLFGFQSGQALIDLVGNARAVVLPSEWYENGPYSAIEALQLGRPVIGSEIGGIPELVDGNGATFLHGNVAGLRSCLLGFPEPESEEYKKMSNCSRQIFERSYTAETHYEGLMKVYGELLPIAE